MRNNNSKPTAKNHQYREHPVGILNTDTPIFIRPHTTYTMMVKNPIYKKCNIGNTDMITPADNNLIAQNQLQVNSTICNNKEYVQFQITNPNFCSIFLPRNINLGYINKTDMPNNSNKKECQNKDEPEVNARTEVQRKAENKNKAGKRNSLNKENIQLTQEPQCSGSSSYIFYMPVLISLENLIRNNFCMAFI